MWIVSTGKPGTWNDSSAGTVLSGDCAAGGGMVSNLLERKGMTFFFNQAHFQH